MDKMVIFGPLIFDCP